jgi:hypothetical protein
MIIVGLDPQPSLLAWHVRQDEKTLSLDLYRFKKKACFKNAQEWQEYIYTQCKYILKTLHEMYTLNHVIIEQQRGRVNSNIEMALLAVCIELQISRKIVHPTYWKKISNIKCQGSNYKNKMESVKALGFPLGEGRVHDLADAYWISFAV